MVAEISKGYAKAQAMRIQGVPFTVVDNTYAISGAQDSDVFADVSSAADEERERE